MPRNVISGLIQCHNPINDESVPVKDIQQAALDHHIPFIEEAGKKGVQILVFARNLQWSVFLPVSRCALV